MGGQRQRARAARGPGGDAQDGGHRGVGAVEPAGGEHATAGGREARQLHGRGQGAVPHDVQGDRLPGGVLRRRRLPGRRRGGGRRLRCSRPAAAGDEQRERAGGQRGGSHRSATVRSPASPIVDRIAGSAAAVARQDPCAA